MEKNKVEDLGNATKDEMQFNEEVKGYDFEGETTIDDIIQGYATSGIQATNLYKAIQEVKRMRAASSKIFMGCTSNVMSSGMREALKYLAKNAYFHVMVITGGGIEEDIIKCFKPTYIGSFDLDGAELRENGWNRIGNLVIHNRNYGFLEEWFTEALDELVSGNDEDFPSNTPYSEEHPLILTPSKLIRYLGKRINNENSVLYWCYKNSISVYSPAITDGSIGDLFTFYNKRTAIKLDIIEDVFSMNTECLGGQTNGAIILGGGLIKHHILNGNLFNNGLDYCVIVNTAIEYDASDAGAALSEAFSWGKVKPNGTCIKVYGEFSIIFPLLVYGAFKSKK